MLPQIINNIYQGPLIKLVRKVIFTGALYSVVGGLAIRICR